MSLEHFRHLIARGGGGGGGGGGGRKSRRPNDHKSLMSALSRPRLMNAMHPPAAELGERAYARTHASKKRRMGCCTPHGNTDESLSVERIRRSSCPGQVDGYASS